MNAYAPLAVAQRAAWQALSLASSRRGARVLLTFLLAAAALLTINITTAAPALAGCAPPGIPNAAGSGMPGFFDQATNEPSGDNYYGLYGYGGLRWNNCELGGPIAGNEWAGDPNAGLDTLIGNVFLAVATFLAAVSTALHKWIGDSTGLLAPMDSLITQLSTLTRTVIINNWFPVVLLAGGVLFLTAMLSQNRRKALTTIIMSMVAIGLVGVLDTIPLTVAHSIDNVASKIQAETDTKALETAGITASKDEALGALLMDTLIWPHWAAGATNTTAKPNPRGVKDEESKASFEDRIYVAGTTPFAQLDQNADEQRDEYKDLAGEMKSAEPEKFQALKGQSYNRASNGFLAAVKVLPVVAFRIPAEAAIFLTLVIMRFIPIVGPIFAVFLVFPSTRALAVKHGRSLFSAVIHTIVVTFFASIHVAAIAFFFTSLNAGFAIILTFVVTIVFFMWAKPLGALTHLLPGASNVSNRFKHFRQERRQDRRFEQLNKNQGNNDGHRGRGAGNRHGQHELVGNEHRVGQMPAPRWRTVQPVGPHQHRQQDAHGAGRQVRPDHVGPQRVIPDRKTKPGQSTSEGPRVAATGAAPRPARVVPDSNPQRPPQNGQGSTAQGSTGRGATGQGSTAQGSTGRGATGQDSTPGRDQVAPDAARVAPTPDSRASLVGNAPASPAGATAEAARATQTQPDTTGGRRIGQERSSGASMSDREAAARGYFVPPYQGGTTTGQATGQAEGQSEGVNTRSDALSSQRGAAPSNERQGTPQRAQVKIFIPPEVEAQNDAANADRIGK